MPYLIDGRLIPEELVRQQEQRLGRDPQWKAIENEAERASRLRMVAEQAAIDQAAIEIAAAKDPRPVDSADIDAQVERLRANWGTRSAFDDSQMRPFVEHQLRLQRFTREMLSGVEGPSEQQVEAFYTANRQRFSKPEMFEAAHVVRNVNHEQSEGDAESKLRDALAELEAGQPFDAVAGRYSDCSEVHLGAFPAGQMVDEFEAELRKLQPGQRSGIFATPFGLHIAELRARTPGKPADFEDVKADIAKVLKFVAEHEAYAKACAELRTRVKIEWVPAAKAAEAPK